MPAFSDRVYDVVIIGGGMLGLSIARDCAMRRLSVALFEKGDFCSGNTGVASGVLSGEPHWLATDRAATRVACEEVAVVQRIAPNLMFRIPTIVPVLASDPKLKLDRLEAFFETYAPFTALKGGRPPTRLSARDALTLEPGLTSDITGAIGFDEWAVDPQRLAILTAKSAAAAGALLQNHTKVEGIEAQEGKIVGVNVKRADGTRMLVRCRTAVNAAGAWAPRVDPRFTSSLALTFQKTVYLVLERPAVNIGIACVPGNSDKPIFLFPHERTSIIGPLERETAADPESFTITEEEIETLLGAIRRYFPRIAEYRFLEARSGIRFRGQDPTTVKTAKRKSYVLAEHSAEGAEGLYTMIGGTPPMARRMAEKITDELCQRLRKRELCRTHLEGLPGCTPEMPWREEAQRSGKDPLAVKRLMMRHGYQAAEILDSAAKSPELAQTLCECEGILAAEVDYCSRREWATCVSDVGRRTRLGNGTCRGSRCRPATARFLGDRLNWSPDRIAQEGARIDPVVPSLFFGEALKQTEYGHALSATAFDGELK